MQSRIINFNPKLKKITEKDIKLKQVIHTYYKQSYYNDFLGIKEKILLNDNTILPNYKIVMNPVRNYYVTKEPIRKTHKYKKEYETLENLDKITCYQKDLVNSIKNTLNIKNSTRHLSPLLNNPYLYKADIDIEALVKMSYYDKLLKSNLATLPLDIGFLDIEIDLNKPTINDIENDVCIISLTINNKVYTTFLKHRMYQEDDITKKIKPFTLEELKQNSLKFYKEDIDKYGFVFNYHVADNIKGMFGYIFNIIKKSHVDFVGIWNMNFDVPFIIQNMKKLKLDPKQYFCANFLNNELKNMYYSEDTYKTSHYALKWHWLYLTAETQYIDSMSLFAILRKTTKFEGSYKLNYILQKYISKKKVLELDADGHRYYASRRYMDYIIYNQFDVMGLYELECANGDLTNMYFNAFTTPLKSFNKTTSLIMNDHFFYYNKKGIIISSAGNKQIIENDLIMNFYKQYYNKNIPREKVIPKTGGAVVRPERVNNVGINIFNKKNKYNTPYFIRRTNNNNNIDNNNDYFNLFNNQNIEKIKLRNNQMLSNNNISDDNIIDMYLENDTYSKPDRSLVSRFVGDLDLVSSYPTATEVYNISRTTIKLFVFLLEIDENSKRKMLFYKPSDFFELFIAHKENSVKIMHDFFGLVNYFDIL